MNFKTILPIQNGIETDVPANSVLTLKDEFLYYEGKKVCAVRSQKSHDCLSLDDGHAEERFQLTHNILAEIAKKNGEYQLAYEEANKDTEEPVEVQYPLEGFFASKIVKKYRSNNYWAHEFFVAPISDLKKIEGLL